MFVKVRIPRALMDVVRSDLARPHSFAAERVGFLFGQLVDAGDPLILLSDYSSLGDERYLPDPYSGARIDSEAIRGAMQEVLDRGQGGFHVHMHEWPGRPVMSRMDVEEIPRVVTALRRVEPQLAHGIILLHQVEAAAWVWLPGEEEPVEAESMTVVGFPFEIHRRRAT